MKVQIVRFANSYNKVGKIDAREIVYPQWDNTSGGCNARSAGYSIYGYIAYDRAAELVDCSGMHDYGNNSAKICVPKSLNKEKEYQEGYKYLLSNVKNKKPEGIIKKRRPPGWKPCTKHILSVLAQEKDGKMTRKELREMIRGDKAGQDGYQLDTIRRALKRLAATNRIIISPSTKPDTEIIMLIKVASNECE